MQQYIEFLQANPLLAVAWIAIFIALIFTTLKSGLSPIKKITNQQATLLINRSDAKVVDIRGNDEFKKGHILGSIHLPLSKIKNNELASLEKEKDSPIIVVCNTGMTSTQACQMLHKAGFTNVHNLQGGVTQWSSDKLPLTKK
ncbi:MAG: rhodanese-like domain-containing protein [Gammaproteobacteria bacterium]|nr:rhodanese-like domain-containing protein [Gammaproteobacteria bacterium]